MGFSQQGELPRISNFKMAAVQWDTMEFYRPSPTTVPPSKFWPLSSHNSKAQRASSTYQRLSEATLPYEEVKRTATHGAAQQNATSSSGQVELPPGQGQLLHTLEAWDEEIPLDNQYDRDATDVSDADTEFPSIEELLLSVAKDSRDFSCMGNNLEDSSVADSDKLRSGKSKDDPILLDSDVRDSGEFDDSLGSSSLQLEGLDADEITLGLCGPQTAIDDAIGKTTLAEVNDTPPLASLNMSEWETESGFCLGNGDDAGPVYEAEGVLVNADKIDKCQPKSMGGESDEEAQSSFAENDDDDEIETDLRTKRSEDNSESTDDIDDEDHVIDSSGSDIEEHPRRSKRRRQAKSAEDSAQTSSYNTNDASFSITNSSNVSSQGTATTLSDSSQESQEIPIRGFLTLKTSQSGILYCLQFSQEVLPFPLEVEQRQAITSSVSRSSDNTDCERPPLRKRAPSRPGRHSTFSQEDDELLIQLKEEDKLPWAEIAEYFPERSNGSLQVHYCTKLKRRSKTSKKSKKRKRMN